MRRPQWAVPGAALAVSLAAAVVFPSGNGTPELPTVPGAVAVPDRPPTRPPLLDAVPPDPLSPTSAGLSRALAAVLADPALGGSVAAAVLDAHSGQVLLDLRGSEPVLPASTAKIATAVAVLAGLPPQTRLTTRSVAGPQPGDVVLVGGGDVTLAGPGAPAAADGARLADLAAQTTSRRTGPVRRVLVDDTAWTGPALGPGWRPGYVSAGDVAPAGALAVDGGRVSPDARGRVADPALAAGRAFAALLGAPRVPVVRGVAPARGTVLGAVHSPPVGPLVETMLSRSDNDLAEALARRLAVERGRPADFAGAAAAVRDVLAGLSPAVSGIAPVDASGLSRDNRVRPLAVAALLSAVARDEQGRFGPVLSGLPVAGFDGTLERRFRGDATSPAAGQVRAKTGTLDGVSALAGLLRTGDGRLLAFDVTLDAVPSGGGRAAEAALDRVAATLAACGCR